MLSPEQIKETQLQAAAKAARNRSVPLVSWPEDSARDLGRTMPFLGEYVPEGWVMEETFFVDASGWGQEGEPALTLGQFDEIVRQHVGSGWAIVEAGQFQVVIGRYEKEKTK